MLKSKKTEEKELIDSILNSDHIIERDESKRLGLKFFYSDKPCKKAGHVGIRLTQTGACRECSITRSKDFYHKHKNDPVRKEEKSAYNKERYPRVKDRHYALSRQWWESHPEKCSKYSKKYRDKNPDKSAKDRLNRGNVRNKFYKNLSEFNKFQIKLIYEVRSILNRKAGYQAYNVDHKVPLNGKIVSGLHVPWNLRLVDSRLNRSKGNRYEGEYN